MSCISTTKLQIISMRKATTQRNTLRLITMDMDLISTTETMAITSIQEHQQNPAHLSGV